MTRDEFCKWYFEFSKTAVELAAKARRESFFSLQGDIDDVKAGQRDIFHYGLRFVLDGTNPYYIDKVLSNLVKQEKDELIRSLKKIQKEAVLLIQEGANAQMVHTVLNSLTDIPLSEDKLPPLPEPQASRAATEPQTDANREGEESRPFAFIRNCDPAEVLDVLTREHPQSIAHVLSYLEPPMASILLASLPAELRGETTRRIATMDRVSLEIIRGIERSIEKKLSAYDHCGDAGGTGCALEILELIDKSVAEQIIQDINGKDPELAEYLKGEMNSDAR